MARTSDLSFRGATRQSREDSCEFAGGFPMFRRVLRDCHVGLWPPRNDKSGGQHRFNGGRYESFVRRRARLSPPLQHPAVCRIFFIVPYSPGKIHPVGKKRSLSVKSMEKRLKTGPFCDTINLYQNECTARRRGLHLHTDTTIIGGKHHECSRDHGTAQRIFL